MVGTAQPFSLKNSFLKTQSRHTLETWEMLVGTPRFQQIKGRDMGNVDKHTWISADKGKIHAKCW